MRGPAELEIFDDLLCNRYHSLIILDQFASGQQKKSSSGGPSSEVLSYPGKPRQASSSCQIDNKTRRRRRCESHPRTRSTFVLCCSAYPAPGFFKLRLLPLYWHHVDPPASRLPRLGRGFLLLDPCNRYGLPTPFYEVNWSDCVT